MLVVARAVKYRHSIPFCFLLSMLDVRAGEDLGAQQTRTLLAAAAALQN